MSLLTKMGFFLGVLVDFGGSGDNKVIFFIVFRKGQLADYFTMIMCVIYLLFWWACNIVGITRK